MVIITATEEERQNTAALRAYKTRHHKTKTTTTAMAKSTATTSTEAEAAIRK